MLLRLTTGREFSVRKGQSVLEALRDGEFYLLASCGGKGTCGHCRVRLLEGRAELKGWARLSQKERQEGMVLACQCYPQEDVLIEVPETSRLVVGEKIALGRAKELKGLLQGLQAPVEPALRSVELSLAPPSIQDNLSDLERLKAALSSEGVEGLSFSLRFLRSLGQALRRGQWRVRLSHALGAAVELAPLQEAGPLYGLAVDVGTTTVVAYLVELASGEVLDVGSTYNSQMRWGDDVITRIVQATEGGALMELRAAVLADVNELCGLMCRRQGLQRRAVQFATLSGNTTMCHLFWALEPSSIRLEPYVPGVSFFPPLRASEAGLRIHPDGVLYTLPCPASYVGGDIVAGVLATGMHLRDEVALLMDIGTNGEVAIGGRDWLVSAACSAGPCFEGGGIRHGMRAVDGAIEKVSLGPQGPRVEVLGDAEPLGICGSGMIDAVAEMFLKGVIDQRGKFHRERLGKDPFMREGPEGLQYVLASGPAGDIVLTEPDLDNILRAKAAIYAGVSTLLRQVGLAVEDIQRVYIAGGFGNYLDVQGAVVLGMLPDLPLERFSFVGNTSIAGAYLCLVSERLREEAEAIAHKMTYVELSVLRGFMEEYMSALFLPHTNMELFPTARRLLSEGGQRR